MVVILVPGPAGQPDTQTDGPYVRYGLGQEADPVGKTVANDHLGKNARPVTGQWSRNSTRKLLSRRELREQLIANNITVAPRVQPTVSDAAAQVGRRLHATMPIISIRRPTVLTMVSNSTNIAELEPEELEASIENLGAQPFHARQIYTWIYRKGVTHFDQMTDLSISLRETLADRFVVTTPGVHRRQLSTDGTEKFLLGLGDGRLIESVFIPDTPRQTLCVSTQVGCAMGCAFCLTGKMGLVRNLTAGEIVGQVRVLSHALSLAHTRFNIVLMGMGEPLHNYDATMKAVRILAADCGFSMTASRITLSTVGLPAALERLAKEPIVPNLAVSLHAATDELREQLVPVSRAHGLSDILAACRRFPLAHRQRITFEYVLLAGVNDSTADARGLAKLVGGIQAKVNLIPLNEAPGIPYGRPSEARIDRFARTLADRRIPVSVRKTRGPDIRAACGQLIVEGTKASPAQQVAAGMMASLDSSAP